MSAFIVSDPQDLTEDQFLLGLDGEERSLDIDSLFAKDFEEMINDMKRWEPEGLKATDLPASPSDLNEDYSFLEIESGLVVLDKNNQWIGGYIGVDVSLMYEHRGIGLGSELILEYFMRNGSIPVWYLDDASYSPDGERAHLSAWEMAKDRELFLKKKTRLENLYSKEQDCGFNPK